MYTVLELFAGLGGAAAAVRSLAPTLRSPPRVTAVDVSDKALALYRRSFPDHETVPALIERLPTERLAAFGADLWWLSPPCQPYTRRGLGRDVDDPRAAGLLALVRAIPEVRPRHLALENVPGFLGSESHRRLREALDGAGYEVAETTLCPTELGVPNRRRRVYLVASLDGLAPPEPIEPREPDPLAGFLDPDALDGPWGPELAVSPDLLERYPHALGLVGPEARDSACFTAAYGRSPVRSGSYLATPEGVRRVSPREIARLLGLPEPGDRWDDVPAKTLWRHLGNSLSVPAVTRALRRLPPFAPARPLESSVP
jgi:site-specific DNA-cytosine methylase